MKFKIIFAIIFYVCFHPAHSADIDPKSSRTFYIETFGQTSVQDDPLYSRVQGIFEKLLRVTEDLASKSTELVIIASESWPWTIALPDNSIVLSVGAIMRCYQHVSPEHGDTRIAMLLGHEIAHLTENDYWHRDVYLAQTSDQTGKPGEVLEFIGRRSGLIDSEDWRDIVRDRELKADDKGAIFALLAGFDISTLLPKNRDSFFQYWVKQTVSDQNSFYLSAAERTNFLNQRIDTLIKLRDAFELGQSLIAMGNLDAAEEVYKSILTIFPAYEVYNNLGYIKLNQSKAQFVSNSVGPFWLPIQVDFHPKTPILLRGERDHYIVKEDLLEAINYFESAVLHNPSYVKGLLNLASAYFLAEKYNHASAVLDQAQAHNQTDPEIKSLQLLTLYFSLAGKIKINQYVYQQHEKIIEHDPADSMTIYNLALLYQRDKKFDLAKLLWEQLAKNLNNIPMLYQKTIADQLDISLPEPIPVNLDSFLIYRKMTAGHKTSTQFWHGDNALQVSIIDQTIRQIIFNDELLFTSITLPAKQLKAIGIKCCQKVKVSYDSIIGNMNVYGQGIAVYFSNVDGQSRLLLSKQLTEKLNE